MAHGRVQMATGLARHAGEAAAELRHRLGRLGRCSEFLGPCQSAGRGILADWRCGRPYTGMYAAARGKALELHHGKGRRMRPFRMGGVRRRHTHFPSDPLRGALPGRSALRKKNRENPLG